MTVVTQEIANKNTSANDRQVGGDHYRTGGMQHWDMFGPEYLMGCATKYVSRWRRKNGIEDLEKALHYAEKLRECVGETTSTDHVIVDRELLRSWCRNAGLDFTETTIIFKLMRWKDRLDVDIAAEGIRHLIATDAGKTTLQKIAVASKLDNPGYILGLGGVALTNTPRAGETEAQSAARERRVPRMDDGREYNARKLMANTPEEQRQRTPDDGAQHSGVYPWVATHAQLAVSGIDVKLIEAFWTPRTGQLGIHTLDPHVVSDHMPRVLRPCYNLRGDGRWTLNVRQCPPDARDYFPKLLWEKNRLEWEDLPEWERVLYAWNEQGNKYELTEFTSAWHVEVE